MRDAYRTTLSQVQGDGTIKALAGIEISVYPVGTTASLATIFQRRDGVGQGPSPEAGASGGPNPFTTGASGAVEFWAGAGVWDIHIRDTQTPVRIAERGGTSGVPPIQWNSMPASVGSIPSTILADDSGITLGSLAADVLRQVTQIGQVIDWWRPSSAVPIPAGFEICDGRAVADHDFSGVSGSINMPDLRNKFVIGADSSKADAAAAVAGDAASSGPGIRGSGGSNLHTLSLGELPSHDHASRNSTFFAGMLNAKGGINTDNGALHSAGDSYRIQTGGLYGLTDVSGGGGSHNNRPNFYGLLKIMKVRRD